MIPLRDTIPSRRFPVVNTGLIAINVLVFLFESVLPSQSQNQVVWQWGLVPTRFWESFCLAGWLPLLTSMFLHGGWWHLLSNMLALYIFGDNVEDRLGPFRYLLFYLTGGLFAGLAHVIAYAHSPVPTVGASGAIAAVLGAYLLLYPAARVLTLVPLFYFVRLVEVPAYIYLGFWFISQLFNGVFALSATADVLGSGGVAWWAHIGGFVFGLAVVKLIAPRRRYPPYRVYSPPEETPPWHYDDRWDDRWDNRW